MIPSDIRLFTWLDVEEVISRRVVDEAPKWLVRASAYWSELKIEVRPQCERVAREWLRGVFDPRIALTENSGALRIILESVNGQLRFLDLVIEEVEEDSHPQPLPPTFQRPSSIEQGRFASRPQKALGLPPIVAFHSFKGGVGRTTHAISLAMAASERNKVLLIDADVEAPGISWLMRARLPEPPVAFSDLIALAHGDSSEGHKETVSLVTDRLRNALIDGCFVLPAFRSLKRLPFLEIRPEHLIKGQPDPFVLTQIISAVGSELGVGIVIVDLRAGYSELAAGLLLDPRVHRVFVTTLSGQAIEGTIELLKEVGTRAPSKQEYEPYPAVIVNQIPEGVRREDWGREFDRLVDGLSSFLPRSAENAEDPMILDSGFDQTLQRSAADWEENIRSIRRSGFVSNATGELLEWLPLGKISSPEADKNSSSDTLRNRRVKLSASAQDMIFAEKRVGDGFLDTAPLRALAGDNISQLPIAVIAGAKGAGKTFTFLQQVRLGSWREFVEAAIQKSPKIDAPISPTLFSFNLEQEALKLVTSARDRVSQFLSFATPAPVTEIHDVIRDHLRQNHAEHEWRDIWLDCIAWGVGFKTHQVGAGRLLAESLDSQGKRLISLFDGLEDLFQEIAANQSQQMALRVLLQDVPLWLTQRPERGLAVLVYIRRDLVSLAVRQNHAQLLDRYAPYSLQWGRTEALRLANWIQDKALGIKPNRSEIEEDEVKKHLFSLWGKKLGSDESREARSAEWVLDALSDYNDQVQARDLVRFISVAAEKSISDQKWNDRDLTPQAIRDSLPECSREKIAETIKENEALRKVFEKFERVPEAQRLAPFDSSFAGLDKEDIRVLVDNGALSNDGGLYYLPEIYLHGLKFGYSKPGRRRVLSKRRK